MGVAALGYRQQDFAINSRAQRAGGLRQRQHVRPGLGQALKDGIHHRRAAVDVQFIVLWGEANQQGVINGRAGGGAYTSRAVTWPGASEPVVPRGVSAAWST